MIRKTKSGYVMDAVLLPTITRYPLNKGDRLLLRVVKDDFTRRFCGSCGQNERADLYSVRAFSPDGVKKKLNGGRGVWICDGCAKKWAPALYAEANQKSAQEYEDRYGPYNDPRDGGPPKKIKRADLPF